MSSANARLLSVSDDLILVLWVMLSVFFACRIKVNSTTVSSEYLLVPVEVQVSSAPGIYSPQDSLDFGLLVKSDKPKTLSLSLINAQKSPVNVQVIEITQYCLIMYLPSLSENVRCCFG